MSEGKEQYQNEWQWFANTGDKNKAPNLLKFKRLMVADIFGYFERLFIFLNFLAFLSDCIRIDMVFIRERCTLCTEHKIQLAKTEKQTPNVRYFFLMFWKKKKKALMFWFLWVLCRCLSKLERLLRLFYSLFTSVYFRLLNERLDSITFLKNCIIIRLFKVTDG